MRGAGRNGAQLKPLLVSMATGVSGKLSYCTASDAVVLILLWGQEQGPGTGRGRNGNPEGFFLPPLLLGNSRATVRAARTSRSPAAPRPLGGHPNIGTRGPPVPAQPRHRPGRFGWREWGWPRSLRRRALESPSAPGNKQAGADASRGRARSLGPPRRTDAPPPTPVPPGVAPAADRPCQACTPSSAPWKPAHARQSPTAVWPFPWLRRALTRGLGRRK